MVESYEDVSCRIFRSFFSIDDGEVFNKHQDLLTKLMQYPPTNLKHPLTNSRRNKRSDFGFSEWVRYILAKLMLQEAL